MKGSRSARSQASLILQPLSLSRPTSFSSPGHVPFFVRSRASMPSLKTSQTLRTSNFSFRMPVVNGIAQAHRSTLLIRGQLTRKSVQSRGIQDATVTPQTLSVTQGGETAVKVWLGSCAALVFGMVVLGGFTRLTESGLSIVDWKPVTGTVPPRSDEEWVAEFEKYKQFPEFKKLNPNMSLSEFKQIFWMEWAHRQLGRAIGLSFGIPLAYFAWRGYVRGPLAAKLSAIFLGICGQGALGWYMVKSGLEEDIDVPRVSQYRLAAHLGSAFVLYTGMLWVALGLSSTKAFDAKTMSALQQHARWPIFRGAASLTAALVFLTALSGAFVAGLDAGLVYNEFPYMGKGLVPEEVFEKQPLWKNFFENEATVQFDHRVLATTTLTGVGATWLLSRNLPLPPRARLVVNLLGGMGLLQYTLGIATLLSIVQTHVAATHQAGSLTLLTFSIWLLHELRKGKVLRK